jgi:hypothetical protein
MLLFVWLRRLLPPLTALLPAVLFLFLGTANDAFVGSHGMPLTLSAATGLAAWLLIERRQLGFDLAATFLLTVGICCNGYTLPFILAAIAIILLDSESSRRRLWIPAVPLALYGLWWLLEGRDQGQLVIANIGGLPSFMFDSLGASLASITGLFTAPGTLTVSFDVAAGQALAGACLVALLALAVGLRYRPPRAAIPTLVALLTFWLLTAGVADPARLPNSSRYLYISVVILLLLLAQMIAFSAIRREGAIALAAICLFALLPNLRELHYSAAMIREQSTINRAVLGAADLVAEQSPGEATLENASEPATVDYPDLLFTMSQYLIARDRFGTPAFTLAEIPGAPPAARAAADRLLVRTLPIAVEPLPGPPRPLPPSARGSQTGGLLKRENGCLRFIPYTLEAHLNLRLPRGGLWVRSAPGLPMPIAVRRFSSAFETSIGPALSGRPSAITLPAAGPAARNWQVHLEPQQPVLVCRGNAA